MKDTPQFLQSILDSISTHVTVIDADGFICFVNSSWIRFGQENACVLEHSWLGVNYLQVCEQSAESGDAFARQAAMGIYQVIGGELPEFYFEYPCHSSDEKRWFMMRVTPLVNYGQRYFVISHETITERKLAEETIFNQARTDGLTGIPNRRHFDHFYEQEWKRCQRLQLPISLMLIDVDHFKRFNDTFGHLNGDRCLQQLAETLSQFARRPGDLHARFGGEEFVLVLGNTRLKDARQIAERLINRVRQVKVPLEHDDEAAQISVSIGLACITPQAGQSEKVLLQHADAMLYQAKENGRDRIDSAPVDRSQSQTTTI